MFNPKQLKFAQKIQREMSILIDWVQRTSSVSMDQLFELNQILDQFYTEFVYKNVPEFQKKEEK